MPRLKIVLQLLAVWLLICAVLSLVSRDFAAGLRDGFLLAMNRDLNQVKNLIGSPWVYWLLALVAVYLLSFVPVMVLATMTGAIDSKIIARLYLPIWIAIGFGLVVFDWLRGKGES